MPKRKRNTPPAPEVPMGIIAVFFALDVAFAKVGSGSSRSLADNPRPARVA
ncbi:hypothetical protein PQQ65_04855 [Paraburkholderia strydomiana]|uniref:hypothetical protein n=1 Tax=Paraburkholderia strydomiana TaxID=1245417 RepID=UPI0038B727AD